MSLTGQYSVILEYENTEVVVYVDEWEEHYSDYWGAGNHLLFRVLDVFQNEESVPFREEWREDVVEGLIKQLKDAKTYYDDY